MVTLFQLEKSLNHKNNENDENDESVKIYVYGIPSVERIKIHMVSYTVFDPFRDSGLFLF